jgi:pseudaminic acid cytidylyltransferase
VRLGLIPARGGSKRIPRKNIRLFFGRPIIAYSIKAALAARTIDRVIVSTDDEEIAAVARAAGADVPFMRTPELSDDHATTLAVIADAIDRVGTLRHGSRSGYCLRFA